MQVPNEEYRPLFGGEVTDRPLFGVSNRRDRLLNLFFIIVTVVIFIVTLVSAFVANLPPRGLNVYFAICISLICLSHVVLIYWYRQGDLDPKFRLMIYYNAFTIILLSTCALSYFFVDRKLTKCDSSRLF